MIDLNKAKRQYGTLLSNCKKRKDKFGNQIEMRLSFEEWLDIWIKSGHYHERGIKSGQYCMSRVNDTGHYEVGNVFIQLTSKNSGDASKGRKKPKALIDKEQMTKIKNGCYKKVISDSDGMVFVSRSEASRYYNVSYGAITYWCTNKQRGFRYA